MLSFDLQIIFSVKWLFIFFSVVQWKEHFLCLLLQLMCVWYLVKSVHVSVQHVCSVAYTLTYCMCECVHAVSLWKTQRCHGNTRQSTLGRRDLGKRGCSRHHLGILTLWLWFSYRILTHLTSHMSSNLSVFPFSSFSSPYLLVFPKLYSVYSVFLYQISHRNTSNKAYSMTTHLFYFTQCDRINLIFINMLHTHPHTQADHWSDNDAHESRHIWECAILTVIIHTIPPHIITHSQAHIHLCLIKDKWRIKKNTLQKGLSTFFFFKRSKRFITLN